MLCKAINDGKQVLVTTHSSYFLLSLDLILREKGYELKGLTTREEKNYTVKLSTNDVFIYHIERNEKGFTVAKKLEIDENGLKEGIPSFIKVEKEILGRIISLEE